MSSQNWGRERPRGRGGWVRERPTGRELVCVDVGEGVERRRRLVVLPGGAVARRTLNRREGLVCLDVRDLPHGRRNSRRDRAYLEPRCVAVEEAQRAAAGAR